MDLSMAIEEITPCKSLPADQTSKLANIVV